MRLYRMHTEVAGTSVQQNIAEGKRAEIGYQTRDCFGKTHCVMKREIRAPFDMNVFRIAFAILLDRL